MGGYLRRMGCSAEWRVGKLGKRHVEGGPGLEIGTK